MTIMGSYPCCGESLWLTMPERTPAYAHEKCPHCGAGVWHKLSRIDPTSYTDEQFLKEYEVNYNEYGTLKNVANIAQKKHQERLDQMSPDQLKNHNILKDVTTKILAQDYANFIIGGDSASPKKTISITEMRDNLLAGLRGHKKV